MVIVMPAEALEGDTVFARLTHPPLRLIRDDPLEDLDLSLLKNTSHVEKPEALAGQNLAPRTTEEQSIIDLYKRSQGAVVYVVPRGIKFDPFALEPNKTVPLGGGTGFIIHASDSRAYILTNMHVVDEGSELEIHIGNRTTLKPKIIGLDKRMDVALLELESPPAGLPSLELGNSSSLEIGQRVLAIGYPMGLNKSLSEGMISSLDQMVPGREGHMTRYIHTSAPINPGNSGGPLLDMAGRVVGINTMIISKSGGWDGIGLAIPMNLVQLAIPDLISTGGVRWPNMGVIIRDSEEGPVVVKVLPSSPAYQAGLRGAAISAERLGRSYLGLLSNMPVLDFSRADRILRVNGIPVSSLDEITEQLFLSGKDRPAELELMRGEGGINQTVSITPIWD